MPAAFSGFPPEAMAFFRGLKRNNNRQWFQARKAVFEQRARAPMEEMVSALNTELARFAPEHVTDPQKAIYRIYRDTRFSKDKTPYKTHIAAVFPRRGMEKHASAGYYFSVSPFEIEVAGGIYLPGSAELWAIRKHLAEHHQRFRSILGDRTLRARMGELRGEQLSRTPKGFPAGHPAEDLLRFKQWLLYVVLEPEIATTAMLFNGVMGRFRAMAPFVAFLNEPLTPLRRRPRGVDAML